MELTHDRTSVHACYYHVVFVAKYRRKFLTPSRIAYMKDIIDDIRERTDYGIVRCEVGERDHVHVFLKLKPKHSVATVVRLIKGNTSYQLFKKFPELRDEVSPKHLWSPSYYVSTVGSVASDTIEDYIASQVSR